MTLDEMLYFTRRVEQLSAENEAIWKFHASQLDGKDSYISILEQRIKQLEAENLEYGKAIDALDAEDHRIAKGCSGRGFRFTESEVKK